MTEIINDENGFTIAKRYILHLCIFVILALFTTTNASAAWHEETKYSCSDPYGSRTFLSNTQWFKKRLPLEFKSVSQGFVYASISPNTLIDNKDLLKESYELETIMLSPEMADKFKQVIERSASIANVPLFVQSLPNISGFFTSNVSSAVIGSLFTYLFDKAGAIKLERVSLIPLVASGGSLQHQIGIVYQKGRYFLSSSYIYSVAVGNESRKIWLYSCTYPANINIVGFRTTVGVNDKRILLEGGKWFVENVSDGFRQDGFLRKMSEDEEFLYFKAMSGFSSFFEDYRISKFGGQFQVRDEGQWKALYTSTKPISQ